MEFNGENFVAKEENICYLPNWLLTKGHYYMEMYGIGVGIAFILDH